MIEALLLCMAQIQTDEIRLLKDASRKGELIRLTPARKYQTGAAWLKRPQSVGTRFETNFRFRLGEPAQNIYGGADGFAFVIQTLGPNAIAGRGASGGFSVGRGPNNPPTQGIPRSLALFFDTFENKDEEDLSGNSIGLFTNGDGKWLPRRLGINARIPISFKDGLEHRVRITYDRPRLSVFLDDLAEPVLRSSVDIPSVVGNEGKGYLGFTAATGEGFQTHDIWDWEFRTQLSQVESAVRFDDQRCLPERTLCTPTQSIVEQIGPDRYHILLPAHVEWAASVATSQLAIIVNPTGTACWNRTGKANESCTGPEGNQQIPRLGLLNESAPAGSLIQESRQGRIFFSVNGRKGEFAQNEGFFEFEVQLRP